MARMVGARVHNSANISVSDSTWTSMTFDSERYDTDSIHSTASNTSRLTCVTAGKYLIIATLFLVAYFFLYYHIVTPTITLFIYHTLSLTKMFCD